MPAYCDPWPVNRNATFGARPADGELLPHGPRVVAQRQLTRARRPSARAAGDDRRRCVEVAPAGVDP